MKEAITVLSNIVHHLQTERGCTSLYLGSNTKHFHDSMKSQFEQTDKEILLMKKYLDQWQHLTTSSHKLLQKKLPDVFVQLQTGRKEVAQSSGNPEDAVVFYSQSILWPLIQLIIKLCLQIEGHHPSAVSAYSCFLQWKERVGLERSIASKGFITHDFSNGDFSNRILFLISEQNSFKESFLSLATISQQELVQSIYKIPEVKQIRSIHEDLQSNPHSKLLRELSASDWFHIVSKKINALHAIERDLIGTLDGEHKLSNINKPAHLKLDNKNNSIYELDIFKGVAKEQVAEIIQHGKSYHVPKNKVVFIEKTIPTHLHIVLHGWVKIYKSTEDGQESIIQIIGNKEPILPHSVTQSTSISTSAQAISDVLLFSIPITVMQKHIHSNVLLLSNFMTTISNYAKTLEKTIESIQLKSANERIQYFLLQLREKQQADSNKIQLPYSKSIIAAYLGMSRETLSRSFSTLKKQGYLVKKDSITIPDQYALCHSCDTTIYQNCIRVNSGHCRMNLQ